MSETSASQAAPEVERLLAAARDALTDDIVARLAGTGAGAIDLLDRLQRADLGAAIPALAALVHNGDLDRITHLARLLGAAEDALTDDMIARLAHAAGGGVDLLDRLQRANMDTAIPVLARMVHDGDLQRLADLARVFGSAQDALTDDMVARLADTFGGALSLLDRLNRGGLERLVGMLERLEADGSLERIANTLPRLLERMDTIERLLGCLESAARDSAAEAPRGGLGGLYHLLSGKDSQASLQFLLTLGQRMRSDCGAPR
jgi:plasmid maintenance system antidote protein VapI